MLEDLKGQIAAGTHALAETQTQNESLSINRTVVVVGQPGSRSQGYRTWAAASDEPLSCAASIEAPHSDHCEGS